MKILQFPITQPAPEPGENFGLAAKLTQHLVANDTEAMARSLAEALAPDPLDRELGVSEKGRDEADLGEL